MSLLDTFSLHLVPTVSGCIHTVPYVKQMVRSSRSDQSSAFCGPNKGGGGGAVV